MLELTPGPDIKQLEPPIDGDVLRVGFGVIKKRKKPDGKVIKLFGIEGGGGVKYWVEVFNELTKESTVVDIEEGEDREEVFLHPFATHAVHEDRERRKKGVASIEGEFALQDVQIDFVPDLPEFED